MNLFNVKVLASVVPLSLLLLTSFSVVILHADDSNSEVKDSKISQNNCDPVVATEQATVRASEALKQLSEDHGFELQHSNEIKDSYISVRAGRPLSKTIASIGRKADLVVEYKTGKRCKVLSKITIMKKYIKGSSMTIVAMDAPLTKAQIKQRSGPIEIDNMEAYVTEVIKNASKPELHRMSPEQRRQYHELYRDLSN